MLAATMPFLVLEHLGKLHRYEAAIVYVLAFGPFLLLGVTIWIARRRLANEDEETTGTDDPVTKPGE